MAIVLLVLHVCTGLRGSPVSGRVRMAVDSGIYLAPCSNNDAQEHLKRTVINGVDRDDYGQYTNVGFGDSVSIWGVKGGNESHWQDIDAGDYLFFYTGDETYSQVAEVLATDQNEGLAEHLWPGFEDTWEFIIYLNEPVPVNIDSNEIADYAGYKQNYILGFQSLRGSAVDEINDEYGSIEGYINANRTDGNHIQTSGGSQDPDEGDDSVVDEVLDEADRDDRAYANIARQLEEVGQVVFYGPPGTGKTYNAQQFARWWLHNLQSEPRESQVRSVTFHPSYTYEDFIEGLTANATENGVSYDIKPGKFKTICEDARVAYQETGPNEEPPRYVLLIDEINRGNLAQIFGETITLLEEDKRGTLHVDLAHSGESFTIPPNLYVIGTMNTADRSVALVDAALRRRFRFIDFPPDYGVARSRFGFDTEYDLTSAARGERSDLEQLQALSIQAVEQLNETIIELPDLGKGKQIGHSYLLVDPDDEQALVDAWRYEILPLLEEYFYGQLSRIRQELFNQNGDSLVDWEREQIKDFDPETLRESLQAIVNAG